MFEVFERKYGDIINAYQGKGSEFNPPYKHRLAFVETREAVFNLVDKAILVAESQGIQLRSDAELFLKINFHQMVALPTELDHRWEELKPYIDEDVYKIIDRAKEIRSSKKDSRNIEDPKREVEQLKLNLLTGGDILKAVADLYDDLLLSSQKIWGG